VTRVLTPTHIRLADGALVPIGDFTYRLGGTARHVEPTKALDVTTVPSDTTMRAPRGTWTDKEIP